jgi:hypothetical protein
MTNFAVAQSKTRIDLHDALSFPAKEHINVPGGREYRPIRPFGDLRHQIIAIE